VILDQDNTIYRNDNLRKQFRQLQMDFYLSRIDMDESKYQEWLNTTYRGFNYNWHDVLDYLQIDLKEFADEVINGLSVEKHLSRDEVLIQCLEGFRFPKYIVTGSTPEFSQRVRTTLEIDELIKETFIVNYPSKQADVVSRNKIDYYDFILLNEGLTPLEVCVFGDSFLFDLKDAHEKGYNTVLVGEYNDHNIKIDSIYEMNTIIRKFNTE
jgi:FMN phosphatase YigB (HAD superfamily)